MEIDRSKIRSIAQKCVWYTSVSWNKFKETGQRTRFEELKRDDKNYYLTVAEIGLAYCEKWEFNPVCPYITNTVVFPAYLFEEREEKERHGIRINKTFKITPRPNKKFNKYS